MKKKFFSALIIGVISLLTISTVAGQERVTTEREVSGSLFRTGPYLQNVSETGATIMWVTSVKCHSWVEWGATEALGNKAQTVVDGQVVANNTLNKIRITGLDSGKRYYYRICSREVVFFAGNAKNHKWGQLEKSPINSFVGSQTDSGTLECIFFNDLHENVELFAALVSQEKVQGFDLSVFNGDCFNDPADEGSVIQLLNTYNKGIHAAERPVIYLRGNHEIRGAYSRQWPSLVDNPGGKQYFSMSWGPVRFVFLDCGEDKADNHPEIGGLNDFEGFHREQAAWLKIEVEKPEFKNAKYRVLVHHIPIYGISEKYFNPWKTLWGPTLNRAGFDVSIHGHTHHATIHEPGAAGDHTYPVIIGGGNKTDNATITVLKASPQELTVKMIGTDGAVVGEYRVEGRKNATSF